jgi:putative ATP-dependent endonuclease of OLD family
VEPEPVDGRGATIVSAAQHEQRQLPLVDQSDGIKALSVLKLLEASPPAVRIIAIDEPETHLHPAAQRSVAKMLRASDRQHVLVTHSPSIVGAMDPMDIVAFRADRQARQLAKGAPIADHDATVRYWSDRLIEPLTARRVALVEGVSDRILVERVAELIGIDLDKLGVVLFELGGASLFPMVYRVLGPPGFDLPLTGLVDEDARASWAETVRVRPAGLEATGFIVSDPDLEGVYIDRLGVAVVSTMLLASPLINEQSLLAASKATTVAEITRERLWTYCRNKRHKIAAALAVAGAIDQAQALALEPLIRFLRLLT